MKVIKDVSFIDAMIYSATFPFKAAVRGKYHGAVARLFQWLVFFLLFSSDYNPTLIGPLFLQSKLLKLLP